MLVLDDLQWADLSSLRLLRFLAVELHQAPVLVVVTFRDAEEFMTAPLFDTLAELQRRTDIERVKLTGLGVDEVTDFIRSSAEIDDDDIAGTAIEVHRRTNGNPFFVTELVRLLESERRFGSVAPAGDVPAAVGDVIRQRLRRPSRRTANRTRRSRARGAACSTWTSWPERADWTSTGRSRSWRRRWPPGWSWPKARNSTASRMPS